MAGARSHNSLNGLEKWTPRCLNSHAKKCFNFFPLPSYFGVYFIFVLFCFYFLEKNSKKKKKQINTRQHKASKHNVFSICNLLCCFMDNFVYIVYMFAFCVCLCVCDFVCLSEVFFFFSSSFTFLFPLMKRKKNYNKVYATFDG